MYGPVVARGARALGAGTVGMAALVLVAVTAACVVGLAVAGALVSLAVATSMEALEKAEAALRPWTRARGPAAY